MPHNDDSVRALREALQLSPDNIPLRQHLAETLLASGRADEAEKEYRHALSFAVDNQRLKVGLASCFYQQGKYSHALVIVEDLMKKPDTPAKAYVLHARLLLQSGEVQRAVRQYREAVSLDPSVADGELANRLGVGVDAEKSPVVDGRVHAEDRGRKIPTPTRAVRGSNGRNAPSPTSAAWRRSRMRFA